MQTQLQVDSRVVDSRLVAQKVAARAQEWLLHSPIVDSQGGVLSWLNPDKPGYIYPEIMGYYLSFTAQALTQSDGPVDERLALRARQRGALVAARLQQFVSSRGAISRGPCDYTFDTAIAFNGLLDWSQARGQTPPTELLSRMVHFIAGSLTPSKLPRLVGQSDSRIVCWKGGQPVKDPSSWSHSFGASTLKVVLALDRAAKHLQRSEYRSLANEIVRTIVGSCSLSSGRFRINASQTTTYTHAHCYAAEGLLYLVSAQQREGQLAVQEALLRAIAWLAQQQNHNGSLSAWHDQEPKLNAPRSAPAAKAEGPARTHEPEQRSDATAQSLRLWVAADPLAYQREITKGFDYLDRMQTASGGLRYSNMSNDVNSWATLFAWQAGSWHAQQARPLHVL